tara:strand:- start:462 stop:677 length:216 start_codon:yes stop_codon:yes gene_type:complete
MLGVNKNIVYARKVTKHGEVFWKKRKVVKDENYSYILQDLPTSNFEKNWGFSEEFARFYDILPPEPTENES